MYEVNEHQRIIRCNQCMHIFPEEAIIKEDETEYCPDCEETGCLMDMGVYGEEDDTVLFPHLSQSRDWEKLKASFIVHILCDFENEIRDYEDDPHYNDDRDDYPTIIQWWEGLMDFKDLEEVYDGI